MLIQLHWQFKDGHTEMRVQRDVFHDDMSAFIEETKKSHPLPEDAVWMICSEGSSHFTYEEKNMREGKFGLMGVGDDGTMYFPNGKKVFRLPIRISAFIQRIQHWFSRYL